MKRFFVWSALVSMLFVACTADKEQFSNLISDGQELYAGFDALSRTYVEDNTYLRWHEDDRLTAFYGNTLNRQYKFKGQTGDNSGSFAHVPSGDLETGNAFDRIYAVYPYDETATITDEGIMSLTLPAVQQYAENSFGKGANTMIAVTENREDTFLAFKNACGYLKLKLYAPEGGVVKSIEVKGNNNEKIAGGATATIVFGEAPVVTMADNATTSITLDCGEGISLGTTAETATEFWVVIPEITFTKGITITVSDSFDATFTQSTDNEVVIERNTIQPMAALRTVFGPAEIPDTWKIYYKASQKFENKSNYRWTKDTFGANIVLHEWNEETCEGVITFDGEVTTIGDGAFCSGMYPDYALTAITIPESVTRIVGSAFSCCSGLTEIVIPANVTWIGPYAFYKCYSLTEIVIPDGVSIIYDYTFYLCQNLISVTIPDSVTTIGVAAFSQCFNLQTINIPNTVTSIGREAFYECSSLTDITIPDSVTALGSSVFCMCASLKNIVLSKNITSIPYQTFYGCGFEKFVIPENIVTIDSQAFDRCLSLTEITISDNVTSIGANAFNVCTLLTNVYIGGGVASIGKEAFYGCTGLTSVTIPYSVTEIGELAFSNCSSLTSVSCQPMIPPTGGSDMFKNNPSDRMIYVPTASVDAYKSASGWSDYAEMIIGNEF